MNVELYEFWTEKEVNQPMLHKYVRASDYDALAAENARLREALDWINQLEYARDTDGSLGPKPPYSWETVARLAFDYAFDALHRPAVQPSGERT